MKYETPNIYVILFDNEDILSSSNTPAEPEKDFEDENTDGAGWL